VPREPHVGRAPASDHAGGRRIAASSRPRSIRCCTRSCRRRSGLPSGRSAGSAWMASRSTSSASSGPRSGSGGAPGDRAAGGAEAHPRRERSERGEESPPWAEPARPAVTGEEEDAPPLGPGSGTPSTARRIGGSAARCGAPLPSLLSLLSRARRAKAASRRASQLKARPPRSPRGAAKISVRPVGPNVCLAVHHQQRPAHGQQARQAAEGMAQREAAPLRRVRPVGCPVAAVPWSSPRGPAGRAAQRAAPWVIR
jgi:hypothetical protein